MFEERKDKAQKTMSKKDKKMEEISSILAEEITPKLDKLRQEKQAYLEYQKVEIELDRLRRLVVAYDYTKHEESINNGTQTLSESRSHVERLTTQIETLKADLGGIAKNRANIEEACKSEMSKNGEFKALQAQVDELSKELVRIKTQSDLKAASASEERDAKAKILESKGKYEKELAKRIKDFDRQTAKYAAEKLQYDDKVKDVSQLEELLQSLTTGVASDEGREGGFMQQLQEAKREASDAATAIEQAKLRIGLLDDEAAQIKAGLDKALNDNDSLLKEKSRFEAQIVDTEARLKNHAYNPDAKLNLDQKRTEIIDQLEAVDEHRRKVEAQMSNFEFQYQDPVRNFDRSKVKGLVAHLITIDEKNKFATVALEITAGARIYN
ncbi:Structural maintenance of chromosomes protein 2, partial [Coemansia sp. RSA 2559]